MVKRLHAGLRRHFLLAANIGLTRRIVAHQHYRQPKAQTVNSRKAPDLPGDPGTQLGRHGLSVDQHRGHFAAVSRICSNAAATMRASPLISMRLTREVAPPTNVTSRGGTPS